MKDAAIDTLSGLSVNAAYRGLVYANGDLTIVRNGHSSLRFTGHDEYPGHAIELLPELCYIGNDCYTDTPAGISQNLRIALRRFLWSLLELAGWPYR